MSYDLKIEWDVPLKEVTDSNGNTFNITARDIAGYTVEHNVFRKGTNETITITGISNTEYVFKNVSEGTYTFSIRSFGKGFPLRYSSPVIFTKTVVFPTGTSRINTIPRGGELTSAVNFVKSTAALSVLSSTYSFRNAGQQRFNVSSATTAQLTQSFSTMSNSTTGFWFYDDSSARADTSDPWKAVQTHTDATAQSALTSKDFDFEYLKEVGASNNGLAVLSSGRTISITNAKIVRGTRVIITTEASSGLKTGDTVTITSVSGMTQLNSQTVVVSDWPGGVNEFLLRNSDDTANIDGGDYSEYTSGGTLTTSAAIRGSGTQSGTTITGKNVSFTTDFSSGDIIKISTSSAIGTEVTTSEYAEVDYIIDSHTISLVSPLTRTYTDAYLYQQALKVDRAKDSILAEVTKSSTGEYSIKYDSQLKALDTAVGEDVNQTNLASDADISVSMSHDNLPHAETVVTNTIDTPAQAANRTINAHATLNGKIGHKGPAIAITNVDLSENPIVVTTGAAHGLRNNCKVLLNGFTDTIELNNQQYFIEIGDESDANTTTKFRLHTSLNRGAVQSVTVTQAGAGYNASTTTNDVAMTSATGGLGSGLTATVVTASNGTIASITPTAASKGKDFAKNETLTLGAIPGADSESTIPILTISSVDWELKDTVNGGSGFTSGGGYTATTMREINPCTVSLKATIQEGPSVQTINGRDIESVQPFVFSHYLVPFAISFNYVFLRYGTATAVVNGTVSGSTATAVVNGASSATTDLNLDGNSGTIAVGMTVTGTGVSGTCTVAAVADQNNITLSNKQTLSNDVTLTFKKTSVTVDGVTGTLTQGMKVTGTGISGDVFVTTVTSQTAIILDENITDLGNDVALTLSHEHDTFSNLLRGKNLYVGATVAQTGSGYSSEITYVQNRGAGLAEVRTGYSQSMTAHQDLAVTYDIANGVTIKEMSPQTTAVDASGNFTDRDISLAGSTGAVTTVGDTTVELQAKTDVPSVAKIQTISNLMADDDVSITTSEPHGFQTGTPVNFTDIRLVNVFGFTIDDQEVVPTNGFGMNNGVVYYVHRTNALAFKICVTSGGSDFVHGRAFFAGDELATGASSYSIQSGLAVSDTATVIDEATVRVDATT